MARSITFKGDPLTLVGRILKTGKPAPDFKVVSQDLKEISLANFTQWKGTYIWYIVVPLGIYFAYKTKKMEVISGDYS